MKRQALSLRPSPSSRLLHFGVLLLPCALLAGVGFRLGSGSLLLAAAASMLPLMLVAKAPAAWRPPASSTVILLYLAALAVLWTVTHGVLDPAVGVVRGLFFIIATVLLAIHDLYRTGAEPRRRARKWCGRLQARRDWPRDSADLRRLPEVYALRDAAEIEPGPIFDLFRDPRAEVRGAAFAAFIGRPSWRPREAVAVLEEARKTPEPEVRAIAVAALGGIDDPAVTSGLISFFQDPSAVVRSAAVTAALVDGGQRWNMARDGVRAMLADPQGRDASLPGAAGALPVVAICDFTVWAFEGDPLGARSVRTLIEHYNRVLQTTGDYDLITDLTNQALDPATATVLRVELAGLLRSLGLLTPELLDRMTNADQPGPVRLLAAEAMLVVDPDHPDGLDVLRGLGRQPNREMALSIAGILQHRLGFDMGLTGEPLPPTGKPAGDVAKRVMAWAVGRGGDRRSATPTPEGFPGSPLIPPTPHSTDAAVPFLEAVPPPLRKLADPPNPW